MALGSEECGMVRSGSSKVSGMCYAYETITVDAGEANTKLETEILQACGGSLN